LEAGGVKNLPISPNTLKNMIIKYGNQVQQTVCNEIRKIKADNKLFSVKLDE
jgi:hypothetical protein